MGNYVTGDTIRMLREKKGYTQKQLSELLAVSDKTVSKWETGKGLPDVCMLEPLGEDAGRFRGGAFVGGMRFEPQPLRESAAGEVYVCPVCGNIIRATGEGSFSCCGITLPPLSAEECDGDHAIRAEKIETDWYVTLDHPMEKNHSISFLAYVTAGRAQLLKLWPEQNAEGRFAACGHGILYAYCNIHGLFLQKV